MIYPGHIRYFAYIAKPVEEKCEIWRVLPRLRSISHLQQDNQRTDCVLFEVPVGISSSLKWSFDYGKEYPYAAFVNGVPVYAKGSSSM